MLVETLTAAYYICMYTETRRRKIGPQVVLGPKDFPPGGLRDGKSRVHVTMGTSDQRW